MDCPETVGVIDEALNHLQQDDPRLVEAVRERYLVPPSKEPYNWGKEHRRSGLELAGQYGQAKFVEGMLEGTPNLRNGFYIEAGAYDGLKFSNSLLFEMRHDWSGLLVEPNPEAFKNLTEKRRKAWLLPRCFSTQTTPEVVEFDTAGLLGGIINTEKSEGITRPGDIGMNTNSAEAKEEFYSKLLGDSNMRRRVRIQCFPVYTVLLALGNPTVHYFSLDIEGAELQVLRTIPLDKVDIKILDIEMNHVGQIFEGSAIDLRRHLQKNSYDTFMKVGIDEIFVKRGFEFNREFETMEEFRRKKLL